VVRLRFAGRTLPGLETQLERCLDSSDNDAVLKTAWMEVLVSYGGTGVRLFIPSSFSVNVLLESAEGGANGLRLTFSNTADSRKVKNSGCHSAWSLS